MICSEIMTNYKLKDKIYDYLYELYVDIDHFDSVRTMISLIPYSPLLRDFDRQKFLLQLLQNENSQSSSFYVAWFLHFMTNDNYSMNDDHERQQYQELIKAWTHGFEHDYSKLHVIIMKIDKLLDPFRSAPTGSNLEKCCELFIHHMIDICFNQGKISFSDKSRKIPTAL